jgi:hypothetical protein
MEQSEAQYLRSMWDQNRCPHCGEAIEEGCGVGDGARAHGRFCSLECFTACYRMSLTDRARMFEMRGRGTNGH